MEPKVVLHDHLDGGVRPATIVELARRSDVALPAEDVRELADWFTITPRMPFSEAWARFHLVIDLLQSPDALHRVAREAVEDLAGDGVIYAELRFAPLNHLAGGMTGDEVVAAVVAGLSEGEQKTGCIARTIVCAIRENDPAESVAAARLAASWLGRGVVGFDLAGNESDFGATRHAGAYAIAREAGLGLTVHAGEMAGTESILDSLEAARPTRIGHGLKLIDDCVVGNGRISKMGPVARQVLDDGITLEVCLTSNSCLGTPVPEHPVRLYQDAGFRLSINADDRAITTTTVGREYELWRSIHSFTANEFRQINIGAVDAAFCDEVTKSQLRSTVAQGWTP
jgi:adenosine deaminase